MSRYEATLGPNTKQWWIYDSEEDVYIDPPLEVLDEVAKINENVEKLTADDIEKERDYLEALCNDKQPDWLSETDFWYPDVEI